MNKLCFTNSEIKLLTESEEQFDVVKNKMIEFVRNNPQSNESIEVLNFVTNGRGVEAFRELNRRKFMSQEFLNVTSMVNKNKTLNIDSIEGLNIHVFRNKNQEGMAPKDLETMKKFVKKGYFFFEGYAPCHNITADLENIRKDAVNITPKLYLSKGIYKPNKFAPLNNVSFRGNCESDFKGCQFVYNSKTGKLVLDSINRGTWDYGKYGTYPHLYLDVIPWVKVGNGVNDESKDYKKWIISPMREADYLDSYVFEPDQLDEIHVQDFKERTKITKIISDNLIKFFENTKNK